jgi:hypothetical protein
MNVYAQSNLQTFQYIIRSNKQWNDNVAYRV